VLDGIIELASLPYQHGSVALETDERKLKLQDVELLAEIFDPLAWRLRPG
jgi:hypothetical protein